jgi:aquaglyceroporin related protein, other eukaryote
MSKRDFIYEVDISKRNENAQNICGGEGTTGPVISPHQYAGHGAPVVDQWSHLEPEGANPELLWSRIRYQIREPLAEFMGVFILTMFSGGAVAQVVLSNGTKGEYQTISWGWG